MDNDDETAAVVAMILSGALYIGGMLLLKLLFKNL